MPAYNFQRKFVEPILRLEKPHTIRAERKYPTTVGQWLSLYTGMRTKQCILIAEAPCMHVERIGIFMDAPQPYVLIDDYGLSTEEMDRLVRRDGFQNRQEFFSFFAQYSREVREDKLRLIWWNTEKLVEYWSVRNG